MLNFTIPESFFNEAKLPRMQTTGHLAYFQMRTLFETDLHSQIDDMVLQTFEPERRKAFQKERIEIERLSTPNELVRYMRKPIEIANRELLCRKGVEMGGEAFSLIIDKLARNGVDFFIESAMYILSQAEDVYIDRIVKEFMDFRNKYARAQATTLLAFRNRKDALEEIYSFYRELAASLEQEDQRRKETVLFSLYLLTGHADGFKEDLDNLVKSMRKEQVSGAKEQNQSGSFPEDGRAGG